MAREMIRKGTRWRVEDGRHIQVAAHKWLNHDPIFLGSPPNSLFVSELIDEDARQWDRGKIQALFAPSTQKEILAIPLNNLHSSDELVWKENSTQNFTVKTAYKIALGLKNQPQGEHSQARQNGRIWKKVRKLNVPPKVRSLLWRASSNILPTKDNLQRRKVRVDDRCEFCTQHIETTCHVLWECPFARNVWALAGRRIQKCSNSASDFFELFRSMTTRLNQQELELWTVIVWALWNARNKYHFEKAQLQPQRIYEGASGLLTDYQHLMTAQTT